MYEVVPVSLERVVFPSSEPRLWVEHLRKGGVDEGDAGFAQRARGCVEQGEVGGPVVSAVVDEGTFTGNDTPERNAGSCLTLNVVRR